MRLIDADALKKECGMGLGSCNDCPQNTRRCQLDMEFTRMDICGMIDDAPTVGGWISVKDRLPEKEGQYLCWFGKNTVCKGAAIATYLEEWKAFGSFESLKTYPNVTHWMPLPEPPEEET